MDTPMESWSKLIFHAKEVERIHNNQKLQLVRIADGLRVGGLAPQSLDNDKGHVVEWLGDSGRAARPPSSETTPHEGMQNFPFF